MIDTVNHALLQLQRAWSARSLYRADHPAVRTSEEEALRSIESALDADGVITVLSLNGRVVWKDEPLPASRSLDEEMFAALRRCGADRVTFRRGLDPGEITEFLDFLAAENPLHRFRSLRNIDLGHLRDSDDEDAEAVLRPCVDRLRSVFDGVLDSRGLDTAELDSILVSVAAAVSENRSALLPLLETKRHDEYTFVHTTNVAVLSGALGELIGLDRASVHDLSTAALLHDVGKQLVPEEILNKKGPVDDRERELLRRHPMDGARMLFETPGVPPVAVSVAFEHHVGTDSGGYPQVPEGWRLGLASRIVQTCDIYDALRTNRPYQNAHSAAQIRRIMKGLVGTVLDADLLELFLLQVVQDVPETDPAAGEESA